MIQQQEQGDVEQKVETLRPLSWSALKARLLPLG